jgi:hypothetical protein
MIQLKGYNLQIYDMFRIHEMVNLHDQNFMRWLTWMIFVNVFWGVGSHS